MSVEPKPTEDRVLVQACRDGDGGAFEGLVRRYQERVYYLAYRVTGDSADALDLTQDTFIRAYRRLDRYDPDQSFKNWLLTICVNLSKNHLRSLSRRIAAYRAYGESSPRASESNPGRDFDLEEALHQLPLRTRTPLILKHVEGLTYSEIAAVMGIGENAAKQRVKRARGRLADLLDRDGGRETDDHEGT
jgi:RNA polymerase sigma-70 factor (ECF subfamily)